MVLKLWKDSLELKQQNPKRALHTQKPHHSH